MYDKSRFNFVPFYVFFCYLLIVLEDFDWRVYPKLEFFEKLRFQNSRKLGFFGCIGSIFLSCLSAFLFIEQPRVSLKFGNSKQSLTSFNDIVFVIS